jgi:UMF1 family MFS transporter
MELLLEKNQKKVINAWAMYDWANSVYSLVITSAIFPIYYNSITTVNGSDLVHLFGREYKNSALYSYSLSTSFLLIAFLSPLLSGIADYRGNKKSFMKFFCILGATSCSALFLFDSVDRLWLGILAFVLASVGWAGSIVFYNAFLPEIAHKESQDKVSAKGFALGYIGSSLLLIFNLVMIMKPELFGITDKSFPARFSFLLVGFWWVGFAGITFYFLPEKSGKIDYDGNIFMKGFNELGTVIKELKMQKALKIFLCSFFFYNMGVQTVMYVAALFGDKELKLQSDQLITTVLIIQFVAIGGAYLFSKLSSIFGNIKTLLIGITTWILICIAAYYTTTATQFYMVAFIVGMVMGGIQSLSRSTYSKMLPATRDHASYFSFYDVCDKIGLVLGTISYGLIEELTGSMRNSILVLISFFAVGLILLLRMRKNNVAI